MPSGFQQDSNQLTPSYYRVVISCGDNNAFWYATDDNDGDDTTGRISTYSWDNFEGNDLPSTVDFSRSLARGNLRFQSIVEAISNLADCQILDIESNNSYDADSQADNSSIAFTIKFDRDEGVFPAYCAIRKQEGASAGDTSEYDNVIYPAYYSYSGSGDIVYTPSDAIRDTIWQALSLGRTRSVRVYHTLVDSDPRTGEGFQETITASKPFNSDSGAWNDIAVQELDGTTTTITTD